MHKKSRIFSRATIKLTLIYTLILMAISICFSIIVGFTATHELERPFNFDSAPREVILDDDSRADFQPIFREHLAESNSRIILALILINFGVLILGAGISFFLARQTLKPIEKMLDEQSRFVSDASHELRTPLAVLTTENEVILRDKNSTKDDFRAQISANLDEIRELQNLTNYLLKLNSAENSVEDFARSENDLTEILTSAVSRISSRAKSKKIAISREISPAKITTNAETLTEICAIILDNAVKYSPEKSSVKIVANSEKIEISDFGGGISTEDLPHIFERFYRAEKSRTSDGFGLGLSLAKNLADKIGAKISAENVVENGKTRGAKFIVKL